MQQKCIYLIFSSTRCAVGAMIRFVTGNHFNHVSVALSDDFDRLYSFARYHKNAPLYGGFVEESPMRYAITHNGSCADIKICKIPLTDAQYDSASAYLNSVKAESDAHIYNLLSALTYPWGKRVHIEKSYTCIEFALQVLEHCRLRQNISASSYYTIQDLEHIFKKYVVFNGLGSSAFPHASWGGDTYTLRLSAFTGIRKQAATIKNVCARAMMNRSPRRRLSHR